MNRSSVCEENGSAGLGLTGNWQKGMEGGGLIGNVGIEWI